MGDKDTGVRSLDEYTKYAELKGWKVYRTSVGGTDSIKDRATTLANYINTLGIAEKGAKVVGHSAGGCDLRYIVGNSDKEPFKSAARTFLRCTRLRLRIKGVWSRLL